MATTTRYSLLDTLEHAWCCKPSGAPKAYKTCYHKNISFIFNWNQVGMASCTRSGYFITGLYRSSCNFLRCIQVLKCCELQVVEGW